MVNGPDQGSSSPESTRQPVAPLSRPLAQGERVLTNIPTTIEGLAGVEKPKTNFPELAANAPLENTSYVYSVPFKGEWYNGNLQRLLLSMLSQDQEPGEAFEVDLIANTGKENPKNVPEKEMREADESVDYVKRIVTAQRLARVLLGQPGNQAVRQEMDSLVAETPDPLLQEILKLAIEKASNISVALVDGTHTDFDTDDQVHYSFSSMGHRRTFGTDFAYERFAGNPDVVVSMWDADTILEDKTSVSRMQRLFKAHPNLHYVFSRMSYLPAGQPESLVADSPRHNAERSATYNDGYAYGAPQIAFRLGAYENIEEIMDGGAETGFPGDEDRTLGYRLIYFYGKLQEGLLLHGDSDFYPATVLTGDRLDGLVDSRSRADHFSREGIKPMGEGLGQTFRLREEMFARIDKLPAGQKEQALALLQRARTYYERQQRFQQRSNKAILTTFLESLDTGAVRQDNGNVIVNEKALVATRAGKHMLLYMRSNPDLVRQVLENPNDLAAMRYFMGVSSDLPSGELTPFQLAMREYVGDAIPFDEVVNSRQAEERKTQWEFYPGKFMDKWSGEDLRTRDSRLSLMHSAVAEILALGYAYNQLFETDAFLESRKGPQTSQTWPEDPAEQKQRIRLDPLQRRLPYLRSHMDVRGSEITP